MAELQSLLSFCTQLSHLRLEIEGSLTRQFWQELGAALHTTFSSIESPVLQSLHIAFDVYPPRDLEYLRSKNPSSPYTDDGFWDIDKQSLHKQISQKELTRLSSVEVAIKWHAELPHRSGMVLSAEEMAQRICLLLQPLDGRGLLSVLCKSPANKAWNFLKDPHVRMSEDPVGAASDGREHPDA